jgi:hypothetical protein
MKAGMMATVVRGGRRLAAQIVVSVIATACAAVAVPNLLTAVAPVVGTPQQDKAANVSRVAPPVDFDAAFVWPAQAPAARAEDLLPPVASLPAVLPVPPRPARPAQQAARAGRAAAPRPAPAASAMPPGEPLQLVAMTAAAAAAPATERRAVFGIPVPRLPYEDAMTGSLARARDTLRNLF